VRQISILIVSLFIVLFIGFSLVVADSYNPEVYQAQKVLKELGFEVKVVLDPTSREMKTVLSEMVYDMGIEENRAILFYYAGHGETEILADKTKMGYIIPRDCPILERDPKGFATHAISMRDIESASMRIHSKHVLMLFDSCFSGSLFALVRAVPDDITEKSNTWAFSTVKQNTEIPPFLSRPLYIPTSYRYFFSTESKISFDNNQILDIY